MSGESLRYYRKRIGSVDPLSDVESYLASDMAKNLGELKKLLQGRGEKKVSTPSDWEIFEDVEVTAYSDTKLNHKLGVAPRHFLVLDSTIPGVQAGATWTSETVSFTSCVYVIGTVSSTLTVSTGAETISFDVPVPFKDGDKVKLAGSGTAPGGLTKGRTYFVRDFSLGTFKLAATKGGAAINLTSTGSGVLALLGVSTATIALMK